MEDSMLRHVAMRRLVRAGLALAVVAGSGAQVWRQGRGGGAGQAGYYTEYRVPPDQVVAVRAARMFDARGGRMVPNPVVLIRGDRITDVGADVKIPPGARVLDLGTATILPGLIDTHV